MNPSQQLKNRIGEYVRRSFDFAYGKVLQVVEDPEAEDIILYMQTCPPIREDLAKIVKEEMPEWGEYCLSEECFSGDDIEAIDAGNRINQFNMIVEYFLAKHALHHMDVDCEYIVSRLIRFAEESARGEV